jgi:hypothetical protein
MGANWVRETAPPDDADACVAHACTQYELGKIDAAELGRRLDMALVAPHQYRAQYRLPPPPPPPAPAGVGIAEAR